ncbi:MAG: AAA family ATPase [Actinomycetia bacterium]|nr:AAA family ATPase [Actinomycetes bacterium]
MAPEAPDLVDGIRPPRSLETLGIPVGLAEDLFMRRVLTERLTTIGETSRLLCISHGVGIQLAESLREKALVEYLGATGRDYRIQLTELGHRTTTQRMTSGRHVGAMPIPVAFYHRVVEAQRSEVELDRETIRAAFADLIIDDEVLDQIGPAFISGGAIFLYGPAGTGKTSLAERLNRVFDDPVLIPRYVEIDGQIVSVYDPSLHHAVEQVPQIDPRWVLCERPLIIVGGELDLTMLDLRYDRVSGVNAAPIQMLANNGVLVVDDFGRQTIRPEELLNRWIVPLSRGIDYLKANTGTKFTVPFELKLVISTNLDPDSLGDDAFLRRLRNKVFIGPISENAFTQILIGAAASLQVGLTEDAIKHLCHIAHQHIGELRPYLAVDFCELTTAVCDYERWARVLDVDMVDRVADLYFVQDQAHEMSGRQVQTWNLPPSRPDTRREWDAYEIGGLHYDDPLAGLDALAATQSIDGVTSADEAHAALQALTEQH